MHEKNKKRSKKLIYGGIYMKKAIVEPSLVAIVAAVVLVFLKVPDISINKIEFVMNAIITCVVTMSGFILTSVSIIIGMSGSLIMKKISRDGGLSELIARYSTTLILSLIVIIAFIILGSMIKDDNIISSRSIIVGSVIVSMYVYSLITTCYYLLAIIARIPCENSIESSDEPTKPQGDFR